MAQQIGTSGAVRWTAVALGLALVLGGCGTPAAGTTASGTGSLAGGGEREIRVVTTEYRFDPDIITVKARERVRFVIENRGQETHEFESDEAQIEEVVIPPAKTRTYTWTAPAQPGTYELVCDLPDHREKGMVGKIIVE